MVNSGKKTLKSGRVLRTATHSAELQVNVRGALAKSDLVGLVVVLDRKLVNAFHPGQRTRRQEACVRRQLALLWCVVELQASAWSNSTRSSTLRAIQKICHAN